MEEEEIMEKMTRFLEEKAELDTHSCYFITKKLNEQYWEEILEEDTQEEEIDDDLPEFDDIEEPKEIEKKIKVNKPKIKIDKESKQEEKEENDVVQ